MILWGGVPLWDTNNRTDTRHSDQISRSARRDGATKNKLSSRSSTACALSSCPNLSHDCIWRGLGYGLGSLCIIGQESSLQTERYIWGAQAVTAHYHSVPHTWSQVCAQTMPTQVCWSKWLRCKSGCQQVSSCRTSGESERSIAHRRWSTHKSEIRPGYGRHHQKSNGPLQLFFFFKQQNKLCRWPIVLVY